MLRPWNEKDAKWLYFYARNPNVGPMAGWNPHQSREESLYIIQTVFSKKETYAITFKGKPIGCITLYVHPDGNYYWGDGNGEIGYWIGEQFWGQGITVEASKIILKHGFEDLKLKTIYATYQKQNKRSKRVLEKLGFKYYDEVEKLDVNYRSFKEIAMYLKGEDYL
ncbi:GNAT family N-acetyltransferase [Methanobrevibacter sp.]|uniref:GNAT family N-acetyltransferase n=1 Tax=Methanobrevibacter sp. TaxID=66852 RepID=UPI0026E02564|nr:GNAT family N-acetyltransferase [Methanobrevibacter sp.]